MTLAEFWRLCLMVERSAVRNASKASYKFPILRRCHDAPGFGFATMEATVEVHDLVLATGEGPSMVVDYATKQFRKAGEQAQMLNVPTGTFILIS